MEAINFFFFNFWLEISGGCALGCGNVGFKGRCIHLFIIFHRPWTVSFRSWCL